MAAFVESGLARLVELELASPEWAAELAVWFADAERSDSTLVMTPTVLEIVAVKPDAARSSARSHPPTPR